MINNQYYQKITTIVLLGVVLNLLGCSVSPTEKMMQGSLYSKLNTPLNSINMSEENQIRLVEKEPRNISIIKNQTEKAQLAAIKRGGRMSFNKIFQRLKNPSEKVKIAAVKANAGAFHYIKNPSDNVQVAYVTNRYLVVDRPEFLLNMTNISEKAQLAVVKVAPYNIKYLKNPTEKVQLFVVNKRGYYISDIKNPTVKVRNHPNAIAYKLAKLNREKEEQADAKRMSQYSSSSSSSSNSSSSSSSYSAPQRTCRNVTKVRTVRVMGGRPGQTTQEHYSEEECSY